MLSLRAWLALLLFYLAYLLVGGFLFQAIEAPNDCDIVMTSYNRSLEIQYLIAEIRSENLSITQESNFDNLLLKITPTLLDNVGLPPNCTHKEMKWNFYNALFFSFTAITTIGYGHLSPATTLGKIICMIYSLLGVPINGIFIGSLGAYFRNKLKKFISKQSGEGDITNLVVLVFQVFVYLIFGHVIFILIPAIALSQIESNWDYLDAVYFAFITLTTIGFGDFVAGRSRDTLDQLGHWEYVYLAGVFIWIVFGLGYLFMIIGVIADGLKKPARKAAKKIG